MLRSLCIVLVMASWSQAATIYNIYQGGVNGTLEFTIVAQVPITQSMFVDGLTRPGGPPPPVMFTYENFPTVAFGANAFYVGVRNSPGSSTIGFSNVNSINLDFNLDHVPTASGTYDLMPVQVLSTPGVLPIGSYWEYDYEAFTPPVPLDTVVISGGVTAVEHPEPSTFILGISMAVALLARWLWSNRRVSKAALSCRP
jgi:hypothetical protein